MAKETPTPTPTQEQGVNLTLTPEALQQMMDSHKSKRKAVKINDADYIGLPNQPLVGKGEGLQEWDLMVVNIKMASRPSTKPGGRDLEGYPTVAEVVDWAKSIKAKEESIAIQNKHVGGCTLSSPAVPNHCTWYFPKGSVKKGDALKCDGLWMPVINNGNIVGYNYTLKLTTEKI